MGGTVLFVGNPGIGKSTIFNTVIGRTVSASGFAEDGTGVTRTNCVHFENFVTYIDTPGVDDMAGRENGLNCIQEAIRSATDLKLFFVVKTEAGRTRVQDITLIKLIIDSLKRCGVETENKYSIILNFCSRRFMRRYENDEYRAITLRPFQEASSTSSYLTLTTDYEVEDQDNVMLENLSENIRTFVWNSPFMQSANFSNFTLVETEWPRHWALERLQQMFREIEEFLQNIANF